MNEEIESLIQEVFCGAPDFVDSAVRTELMWNATDEEAVSWLESMKRKMEVEEFIKHFSYPTICKMLRELSVYESDFPDGDKNINEKIEIVEERRQDIMRKPKKSITKPKNQ